MTIIKKYQICRYCVYLCIVLMLVGVIAFIYAKALYVNIILGVVLCLYLFGLPKRKLQLKDADYQLDNTHMTYFSNSFPWVKLCIIVMVILCLYLFSFSCALYKYQVEEISMQFFLDTLLVHMRLFWMSWVIPVVIIGLIALRMLWSCKNTYVISNDVLYVCEYHFLHESTKFHVPISLIKEVYVKKRFSLCPIIILQIDNVYRSLYCTNNAISLAVRLKQQ